jgi:hemoglobin-like flavoprotein
MDTDTTRSQQLFIVRTWQEPTTVLSSEPQWRGSVEHVPSGQRLYFSDLAQLNRFIGAHSSWLAPTHETVISSSLALSPEQIALIQTTFKQLAPRVDFIVKSFYARLWELAPPLRELFPEHMEDQTQKFVTMLTVIIEGLNHMDQIMPILQNLGYRHTGYGVRAADYPVVGEALLWAIERALNEDCTPEVRSAWRQAYAVLADHMLRSLGPAANSAESESATA